MRRRGSFDPSDYAFGWHLQKVSEILRDSNKPLSVEELARLLGRASSVPGDGRRAAYQIEGHEDRERGWQLLTVETIKILKRGRHVNETKQGLRWAHSGDGVVQVKYRDGHLLIHSPEERARLDAAAESTLRLTPNPFTGHHVYADSPMIREGGNLPGRLFEATHRDTADLRDSLLAFGYVPQLPILVDEHGTVLDGRTRVRLCAELREEFPERKDLEPEKLTLYLGDAPEKNAERLKIALTANVGRRNLSTETKREIARYLYDEENWTYERIAEAFNVSKTTAQRFAAEARKARNTQARARRPRYVDQPEWQTTADPLIYDWIEGKLSGDEVIAELKARGSKGTGWGTINERKAQLEADLEKASSGRSTVDRSEEALGNKAPERPKTPTREEPTVIEELGYVIAALEEHGATPMHLLERLRTILARLDGSIVDRAS